MVFHFKLEKLYYFIFGCSGPSLLHTGFLQLRQQGLLLVVVCEFRIVGPLLLQSTGSRKQAQQLQHRLYCSMAPGTVPD